MTDHHSTEDRISELPGNILDNILGNLPIKDVGRTSILSKKWRYKWVDLSNLLFCGECGERIDLRSDRLLDLVYQVLLTHRGQIDKFRLYAEQIDDALHFNDWILVLRKKVIKNLTFDFSDSMPQYDLPSSLFSCQQLNHLCVTNCIMDIPQTFKGFSNLVSLQLIRFSIYDDLFESLIRSCPMLERLVLSDFHYMDCLTVNAPKLKYLQVEGEFSDICIENSPLLLDVSFNITSNKFAHAGGRVQEMRRNSVWSLCCLSQVRNLTFAGYSLKFLAASYVSRELSIAFNNLEVLELSDVKFHDLNTFSVVLFILRCSSSSLQRLHISASGFMFDNVYQFMKAQHETNFCFNQLRVVNLRHEVLLDEPYWVLGDIEGLQGWRSDLELIKLVLASSPKLENMMVRNLHQERSDLWFKRKLLSFDRASAQLIFRYVSGYLPRSLMWE